jgi:hypothetical protein
MLCGCISSSLDSLISRFMCTVLAERCFMSCSLIIWSRLILCSDTADLSVCASLMSVVLIPISFWLFFLLTQPVKVEQKEWSETLAYKIQMPGNHTEESLQKC